MVDDVRQGICVIMAGGRGTRFWPLSRSDRPKQLLPLAGPRSLLRDTVDRVLPLVGSRRILIITSGDLAPLIAEQVPELSPAQIVAEPVGRNTAPCAVLGLGLAARLDPAAPVALLPADHAIADGGVFREQLADAFARANAAGGVVTLGIPPTRPETGYGYLEVGDPVVARPLVRTGVAFVEKPDGERATAYLAGGRHLWNSGIFVWHPGSFAAKAREHATAIVDCLAPALAAHGTEAFAAELATAYAACPAISVDHAIMEKLPGFEVIPARFGWSDLGSWSAWGDLSPELEGGNRGSGNVISLGSRGNVVHAGDKVVALVDVEDLIVVDTGDALLICPVRADQRVKDLTDRLAADGRIDLL